MFIRLVHHTTRCEMPNSECKRLFFIPVKHLPVYVCTGDVCVRRLTPTVLCVRSIHLHLVGEVAIHCIYVPTLELTVVHMWIVATHCIYAPTEELTLVHMQIVAINCAIFMVKKIIYLHFKMMGD